MPPAAISSRRGIKTRDIIDSFDVSLRETCLVCVINPFLYASRSFKVTDVGIN